MAKPLNTFRADLRTLPSVKLPAATIHPFSGEHCMLVYVEARAGTELPAHSHRQEQLTFVESGRIWVEIEGQEPFEIGPHELAYFPANVLHQTRVLEDTISYDVFSPPNDDLARRAKEAQGDLGYGA